MQGRRPATPVEVLGLGGLPQPGDAFQALADAAKARQIALFRQDAGEGKGARRPGSRLTLESLQQQIAEGGMKELPIIVKADVQGSAEVLGDTLTKLTRREGQGPHHPQRRRRDQRVGRPAGVRLERDHHRLQRPARPQRRRRGGAREGRHPPALGHLQRRRRDEEGDDRAARADVQGSPDRQRPRCARPSRCRSSAPSPAAWCSTGASRARGDTQARLLRDNVVVYEGKIGSLRRFKDDVSRGQGRLRVRHRLRAVQRPQGRRRHRGVRQRTGRRRRSSSRIVIRLVRHGYGMSKSSRPDPRRRSDPRRDLPTCSRAQVTIPGIGFLTVTHVKVTPDLQQARVYYTTLGDERRGARPRGRSSARPRSCGGSSAAGCGCGACRSSSSSSTRASSARTGSSESSRRSSARTVGGGRQPRRSATR